MSSEQVRGEYYHSHKDDDHEWGEPQAPKARRRLASMISVRLAPDEVDVVRQAAQARGMSVSAFLRAAALGLATSERTAVPGPSRGHLTSAVAITVMSMPPGASVETVLGRGQTVLTADAA